jgi:arylsulfatase A-like enzyme
MQIIEPRHLTMKQLCATAWTLAVLLLSWPLLASSPASAANVVLLLMDDAAASDIAGMPTVQQLAREGASFDHAYTDSPMCAPSRAIIQTGLYSQNNGVTQNGYQQFVANGDLTRTFAYTLHNAGDDTRFIGKYINGAPITVPGWDSFIVHLSTGDSGSSVYYNYALRIDGRKVAYGSAASDYSTDVYRGFALQDIQAAVATRRPFFTMVSVDAPHNPLTAAPRYLNAPGTLRQRTLLAVDDALKAIVGQLKQQGLYNSTYVVVTSDQGLAFGHKPSKGVPYEGSINVPLVIRGPGVEAGAILHQLVSLADLAPTLLDWMGAPAMETDGRSLAPLLGGSPPAVWRQAVPITHERMSSAPEVPSWRGVRTAQYAYWKFAGGGTELYDMTQDPGQKRNIAGTNPAVTQKLAALSGELATCKGTECRQLEDQGPK